MSSAKAASSRVLALDLTKGALVVCMVIYHSLNYTTRYQLAFEYMAFLPPSFIVITGFLLSSVYQARPTAETASRDKRLLLRGAKLLLLFTVLNVLARCVVRQSAHGPLSGLATYWQQWFDTYVSGNGRLVLFEVLLPIAYLLLLAPVLLWLDRGHQLMLPLLTALVLVAGGLWERQSGTWLNAALLSAGLVGMVLGRCPLEKLQALAGWRLLAVLAYAGWFLLGGIIGQTFLVQLVAAVLALMAIYSCCTALSGEGLLSSRLLLLGRYSLVAYIVQIGILQVLVRLFGRPSPASVGFCFLLLGTLVLTAAIIELLDQVRLRSQGINGVYKAVFA